MVIGLICNLIMKAQDFKSTKWASSNRDSAFYKADTIRLLKLTRDASELSKIDYLEDLPDYYNGSDFIVIEFKKKSRLKLSTILVDSWLVQTKKGEYRWSYNKKEGVIRLFLNDQSIGKFKIGHQSKTHVKSRLSGQSAIITDEIALVRM